MQDTEFTIRARRKGVELYATTRNATLVCRRCGFSAPTLRKWWRRISTYHLLKEPLGGGKLVTENLQANSIGL